MINVGVITSSIRDLNSNRGVGKYTSNLIRELKNYSQENNIHLIEIPSPNSSLVSQVDIVHFPFFDLFYHTLPIIKNKKTIVTIHDVVPLDYPSHYPPGIKGSINFYLQRVGLLSVEKIITDSVASVESIKKHLKIADSKIAYIPLAAAPAFKLKSNAQCVKIKQKYSLPDKFLVSIINLNYNKNLPLLFSIADQLPLPIVLVGAAVSEIESIDTSHSELRHIENIKKNINNPNIIRIGGVDEEDLVALLNAATIYIQPSFAEGFGIPPLEALNCDTPVLLSNASALSEIAPPGYVGFFDPNNKSEVIGKINQFFKHVDIRTQSLNEMKKFANRFSWEKTAKQTINVYQSICR